MNISDIKVLIAAFIMRNPLHVYPRDGDLLKR
jgi:hypothetical protein